MTCSTISSRVAMSVLSTERLAAEAAGSTASGEQGGIRFWGRSFVADPFGRVLARASDCEEELLLVECDLSAVESVRRDWPFLRDRRIDAYADLLRRFRD